MKYFLLYISIAIVPICFSCKRTNTAIPNSNTTQCLSLGNDTSGSVGLVYGEDTSTIYDPVLDHIKFDPIIKNRCTQDRRLYVYFRISADSVYNDTVYVEKISIVEIRDEKHEIVKRLDCMDDFTSQLYAKTYICFTRKNVKRILSCVALRQ